MIRIYMQGLKHESPFSHSSRSGDHRQHNWQYIDLQICFSLYVVLIFLNKEIVNFFLKILHLDTNSGAPRAREARVWT